MENVMVYLEGLANQSGVAAWVFALVFKFVAVIALYGFARLLAMLIVKWMPDGKLRRALLKKAPD